MAKHLEIVLYAEDGWNDGKIESVVQSKQSVKQYAYILHDKDLDDDGQLKKPHYHLYLNFGQNNVQFEHVAKWFNTSANKVERIKTSKLFTIQYYLHKNEPGKHQYPLEAIRANFDAAAFLEGASKKASFQKILEQCADGTITPYNYEDYIDPVTYAKHGNQIARAWDYAEHSWGKKADGRRDCRVIWAYGQSGVGKTTVCRLYAEKLGLSVYLTATGADPLSHYCGQPALILDDLRPNPKIFTYEALLKTLDPHHNAPVHSRYRDKTLQCSHIFITTIEHPRDFVSEYKLPLKDSAVQLYRRLDEIWEVTEDTIRAEKYDLKHKIFSPFFTTENPLKVYLRELAADPMRVCSTNIFRQIVADSKSQLEIEGVLQPSACTEETTTNDETENLPF